MMLNLPTARRYVAIAGRVTDAVTSKPIAGAQVRITEAPKAFVERLVISATDVRSASPALNSVRAVLDDPTADTQKRLAAAQTILDSLQARQTAALKRLDQTVTTTDGSYFFMDLKEGPYKLSVSLPGSGSRHLFDGYLFGLDVAFVTDLDNKTISAGLDAEFQSHKRHLQDLPSPAQVLVTQAGSEWTIYIDVSGTTIELYHIRKKAKTLNVYVEKTMISGDKFVASDMSLQPTGLTGQVLEASLFNVDTAGANDLDATQLPQTIGDELEKYVKSDSQHPITPEVKPIAAGSKWAIKVNDHKYLVLKQDGVLNVYDQDDNQPVMAEVRVVGSGEYTFSSVGGIDKGQYLLVGLEKGSRKVRVSASGYETPPDEPVKLEQGVMIPKDFRLKRLS